MKIEIDIPELDEKEWEYLGIAYPRKEERYYYNGNTCEWRSDNECEFRYPTFRRRKSWKDQIVWPRCFRPGYVVRKPDDSVCWSYGNIGDIAHPAWGYLIDKKIINLSFLPKEFWECSPEESLCEVKHGKD